MCLCISYHHHLMQCVKHAHLQYRCGNRPPTKVHTHGHVADSLYYLCYSFIRLLRSGTLKLLDPVCWRRIQKKITIQLQHAVLSFYQLACFTSLSLSVSLLKAPGLLFSVTSIHPSLSAVRL